MSDTPSPFGAPSPLAPDVSPLTEADPSSINEFLESRLSDAMNRRPLELTDNDLRTIVAFYRQERGRFILEAQAKAAAPHKTAKKAKPTSVADALASSADLL